VWSKKNAGVLERAQNDLEQKTEEADVIDRARQDLGLLNCDMLDHILLLLLLIIIIIIITISLFICSKFAQFHMCTKSAVSS